MVDNSQRWGSPQPSFTPRHFSTGLPESKADIPGEKISALLLERISAQFFILEAKPTIAREMSVLLLILSVKTKTNAEYCAFEYLSKGTKFNTIRRFLEKLYTKEKILQLS